MKTLKQHTSERNFEIYLEAIHLHETDQLNEFIGAITGKLKKYYNFMKELADTIKVGVKEIIELLKNKGVFTFFSRIGFSLKKMFDLVKSGFKYYRDLQGAIAEYMASTKVVQWTTEKLKQLDEFLAKHPNVKRFAGLAVGAMLLYIWLNMSFTGDFDYDFDQSTLIGALLGKFTISSIFAGPEGIKLLTLFVTGTLFSFPWPGPQGALFVGSMLYGLAKTFNVRAILAKLRPGRDAG